MESVTNIIYVFDLFGTLIFAITGALRGVQKELDFLGVIVFACTVGCGGGMLRDSLIGATPAAALTDWAYLVICVIVGVVIFFVGPHMDSRKKVLIYCDALGLGVFTSIGVAKGGLYGCSLAGQLLCGVITAVGGGMIRDVLSKEIPAVLTSDIYATASLAGGIVYLLLEHFGLPLGWLYACCTLTVVLLRAWAIKFHLRLPRSNTHVS
ncbi:MAG: trimeric intracellular cation channel family protein [Spirochaetia bacterium]|jgi:uncharacterized membrane protein YeiH|nr:trimeric intracellular cation channel family protein [Spirochaetia bacterium]